MRQPCRHMSGILPALSTWRQFSAFTIGASTSRPRRSDRRTPASFPPPTWTDTVGPVALSSPTGGDDRRRSSGRLRQRERLRLRRQRADRRQPPRLARAGRHRPGRADRHRVESDGRLPRRTEEAPDDHRRGGLDLRREPAGRARRLQRERHDALQVPHPGRLQRVGIDSDAPTDTASRSSRLRRSATSLATASSTSSSARTTTASTRSTPNGQLVPWLPDRHRGHDLVVAGALSRPRHRSTPMTSSSAATPRGTGAAIGGFVYDFTYVNDHPKTRLAALRGPDDLVEPGRRGDQLVRSAGSRRRDRASAGSPPYKPGTDRVYAFYAKSGRTVPGWPVATAGPTFGSPAIGTLAGSTTPRSSTPRGAQLYSARVRDSRWSTPGRETESSLGHRHLIGPNDFSSPVLVDLTGSGGNDVVVGSSTGLFPLDGSDGSFPVRDRRRARAINTCLGSERRRCRRRPRHRTGIGWHLFEACGGPQQVTPTGRLIDYPLRRRREPLRLGRCGARTRRTKGWRSRRCLLPFAEPPSDGPERD